VAIVCSIVPEYRKYTGASNEGFMTAERDVLARWVERTALRVYVKGHEATQVTGLTKPIGQGA
jgi:hypothetical protein